MPTEGQPYQQAFQRLMARPDLWTPFCKEAEEASLKILSRGLLPTLIGRHDTLGQSKQDTCNIKEHTFWSLLSSQVRGSLSEVKKAKLLRPKENTIGKTGKDY